MTSGMSLAWARNDVPSRGPLAVSERHGYRAYEIFAKLRCALHYMVLTARRSGVRFVASAKRSFAAVRITVLARRAQRYTHGNGNWNIGEQRLDPRGRVAIRELVDAIPTDSRSIVIQMRVSAF